MTDFDTMACSKKFVALPKYLVNLESGNTSECFEFDSNFPDVSKKWLEQTVLRINSENIYPGFTLLFNENDPKNIKIFTINDLRWGYIPKVCWTRTLIKDTNNNLESHDSDNTAGNLFSLIEGLAMDWVDAINCPTWPKEAEEWKTRERRQCWPSPELIEAVVNGGCSLVAKSHDPNQGYDTICEWRFSFSRAELILIHSWTYEQKLVYHILRLIKNEVLRNCEKKEHGNLATYHFKTLMLWACEEKPPEFWEVRNLKASLEELLCTMIEWLIEKKCRNYFISSNNMFYILPPKESSETKVQNNASSTADLQKAINSPKHHSFEMEVQNIVSLIADLQRFIDSTKHLHRGSFDENRNELKPVIPNKLFTILQLRFYHANILDPKLITENRYMPSRALEEAKYFTSKVEYLYRALCLHRHLVEQALEEKEWERRSEEIIRCFDCLNKVTFEGITRVSVSPFDNFHEICRMFLKIDIDGGPNDAATIPNCEKEMLLNFFLNYLNDGIENPFYFICCAYEANFHYTAFKRRSQETMRDHWLKALDLCNDGLRRADEVRNKNTHWIAVENELMPVVMSKEFSSIFDTFTKSGFDAQLAKLEADLASNFVIHFSVEDYLRYIRVQCWRNLDLSVVEDAEITFLDKSIDRNSSRLILIDALRQSSRQLKDIK